jgi:hypothetical protein
MRDRAVHHNSKDGVKPMTKEEQDYERDLNWKLIKQVTMAIFKMDVTRFSFPVGYCEPRTFIERAGDLFSFLATDFIDTALATGVPEQRFALITVGVIASFHLLLQSKKPWNPALGETFVARWPNGATFFGEQTSHHPAISCIQIRGRGWKIDASLSFGIDQGLVKIDVLQKGLIHLEIADGSAYEWEFPTLRATGLLRGDRIVVVRGSLKIRDIRNALEAVVKVDPKNPKKKGIAHCRATTIWGGIRAVGDKKQPFLRTITGDYAGKVFINGEQAWDIETDFAPRPLEEIEDAELLPSDGRFRVDRSYLIRGDEERASQAKNIFEELQRRDAQLRQ